VPELLTVGHGTLDRLGLAELLLGAAIEVVIDVRRFPGSRRNPDMAQSALVSWLGDSGIDYRWEEDLGGRRRLPPQSAPKPRDSDCWWTVPAFRAYAGHTRTQAFTAALDRVLDAVNRTTVAVMCSETVWWRCHRRLIADVAVLGRQVPVRHVMPGGRLTPHHPAEGARRCDDGSVVWDGRQGDT
jgi:uncharacterized protein (DUF488 family)